MLGSGFLEKKKGREKGGIQILSRMVEISDASVVDVARPEMHMVLSTRHAVPIIIR